MIRPLRSRLTPRRRVLGLLLIALLAPFCWSYGGYLTAPGGVALSVRTVDWIRDHGFESAVNRVERWWYTRHRPTAGGPSSRDLPATAESTAAIGPPVGSMHRPLVPGEGRWHSVAGLVTGNDVVEQTFTRPDPKFASVVADLVRFDQRATRLVYVPGTKEPGSAGWAWGSRIPPQQQPRVVAAFNAGFKFRDTKGGVYTEGRHAVRPLAPGLASVVIYRNGTADVVRWGREAPRSDMVSVRQNLALIVDGGRTAKGLLSDRGGRWGTRRWQFQFTWRSAIGTDAQHRLIYAAGRQMSLTDLATAMVEAGAVRAMELDIHDMVAFNWFRWRSSASHGLRAEKLMASMPRSSRRYLTADRRDFYAVLGR